MKLTLTDDDGVVIESWYISEEDMSPRRLRSWIDSNAFLPTYESKQEYEEWIADKKQ